ncbi:MAG: hypothetical protein OKBPIBMD_02145 [Chlorobi bacterium]|nr:hypothetical protein [Chlorobiota bacterium]
MCSWTRIVGFDFNGGVGARGCGAANKEGYSYSPTFHFGGYVNHFVERWRNQA